MIIDLSNYKEVLRARREAGIGLDETGDLIRFQVEDKIVDYSADHRFLHARGGKSNETIFYLLGLDKYDFCKKAYHHTPHEGDFPEAKTNCKEAVINVTYMLFQECEKYIAKIPKIELMAMLKDSFLDKVEEAEMPKKSTFLGIENPFEEIDAPRPFVRAEPQPVPRDWEIRIDLPGEPVNEVRAEGGPARRHIDDFNDWLEGIQGEAPMGAAEAFREAHPGLEQQMADMEAQAEAPEFHRLNVDMLNQVAEQIAEEAAEQARPRLRRRDRNAQAQPRQNDLEANLPW